MGTKRSHRWPILLLVAAAIMGAIVVCLNVISGIRFETVREQLRLARTEFEDADFQASWQISQDILEQTPNNPEARALAGLSASRLRRYAEADEYLNDLPLPLNSLFVYDAWIERAELLESQGQVDRAIELLDRLHAADHTDILVLRRLASLYAGCGHRLRATDCLRKILTLGHASPRELTILAMNGEDLWDFDRVLALRERCPTDHCLIIAHARHLSRRRRLTEARSLLDSALSPPFETELLVLRLQLAEREEPELFERLPWTDNPDILALRAAYAESFNLETASKHAAGILRSDPFNAELNYLVGSVDAQIGWGGFNRERFEQLRELRDLCRSHDVFGTDRAMRCVTLLKDLQRFAEAEAWCRTELRLNPNADSAWAQVMLAELRGISKTPDDSFTPSGPIGPAMTATEEHDFDNSGVGFGAPDRDHSRPQAPRRLPPASESRICFVDVASSVGLPFEFYNGARSDEPGRRMYEFTGGGAGVLDLDGDAWPDLFFAQGADYPAQHPDGNDSPVDVAASDRLFRNRRGQDFMDVSEPAGIKDPDFGQGVAVGDVNNDGFDDVYVANFGCNRLWINQGDGTFLQQTPHPDSAVWTISAAIADINGDAIPDLYDVNYVGGGNVLTQVCEHEGHPGVCGPTDFPAEQDVLLLGNGNGCLIPAAEDFGIVQPDGRGMGIIVGDIVQSDQIQILVANDESPNFFFEPVEIRRHRDRILEAAKFLRFENTSVQRGLAFGRNGNAQGSMGIAVGDVNCDLKNDLFLTNYYGESNNLHIRAAGDFYPDAIAQARLDISGRSMLGFGTQFLDADNDGDDDLFVANGHLDDLTHRGTPYKMRPQLFENISGQFRECDGTAAEYLTQPVLGRAVARLDWNRDGRMDLCVTHLDRPVALLENRTEGGQRPIGIRYTGVEYSRDGIGVVIGTEAPVQGKYHGLSVGYGREPIVQWLNDEQLRWQHFPNGRPYALPIVAGDGYECSNERLLSLVVSADCEELQVALRQVVMDPAEPIDEGRCVRIIENRPYVWRIPK